MGISITIPQKLATKVSIIAKIEGFKSSEEFLTHLIEDRIKVYEAKKTSKKRAFKNVEEMRKTMLEAGLTEEEILDDFDKFRNTLDRETFLLELKDKHK